MRFLHTADWHVGKPLRSRSRMDEYARALEQVAQVTKDQKVDAVLIAGDIFDSPRHLSPRMRRMLARRMDSEDPLRHMGSRRS